MQLSRRTFRRPFSSEESSNERDDLARRFFALSCMYNLQNLMTYLLSITLKMILKEINGVSGIQLSILIFVERFSNLDGAFFPVPLLEDH